MQRSRRFFINASFKQRKFQVRMCDLCQGRGRVDWITAITKKRSDDNEIVGLFNRSTKDIHMKCSGHLKCKKKLKRLWKEKNQFKKFPIY